MSDTSAFIAGCATTGAAALILLLARLGAGETPVTVENSVPAPAQESVMPVPAPPPPSTATNSSFADETLVSELQDQQALIARLETQISQQDLLLQDLSTQLEQQRQETQVLANRLNTHETSVSSLTAQQQQFAGVQRDTDKAQSSLLWMGAGLVMVVLIGGALVLVILVVLVAFQSRSRSSPSSQVVYSTEVPVQPNPYYRQEFLPPTRQRRVYPQDIYD
ncbi:MAG: hypothetical protein ACFBSF_02860 [Leptolyngbyaceae cyanobacterium]